MPVAGGHGPLAPLGEVFPPERGDETIVVAGMHFQLLEFSLVPLDVGKGLPLQVLDGVAQHALNALHPVPPPAPHDDAVEALPHPGVGEHPILRPVVREPPQHLQWPDNQPRVLPLPHPFLRKLRKLEGEGAVPLVVPVEVSGQDDVPPRARELSKMLHGALQRRVPRRATDTVLHLRQIPYLGLAPEGPALPVGRPHRDPAAASHVDSGAGEVAAPL
mmetsp:Transcript_10005/g.32438  ORF Transcript_10005/g.32438 Transcript_10005/m.32438 type:complete len:218 (+) Transcript_10005:137-790(+)